jgi:hypothetical protein
MLSFPKIWRDEYYFGKRYYTIGLFNILPEYSDENVLGRVIELARHLHVPDFIYNNSAWFLYVSAKLEKDLIHQNNIRNVQKMQQSANPNIRLKRR